MMNQTTIGGKTVSIFPGREPCAPVIYLNTFAEEGQQVYTQLHKSRLPDFSLVSISDINWNHDLVPWDSPPVFPNGSPCTGGADAYLSLLTETILPAVEKELPGIPKWRGLAGYSLAGLFAVYALYGSDRFSRIACMSGSLWFPGIREYILSHSPKRMPDCLYFSLGSKESRTRNPVLQTVQENTEIIRSYYQQRGIFTFFQLNPGNHYSHTAERTAAGIAWLLQQ